MHNISGMLKVMGRFRVKGIVKSRRSSGELFELFEYVSVCNCFIPFVLAGKTMVTPGLGGGNRSLQICGGTAGRLAPET